MATSSLGSPFTATGLTRTRQGRHWLATCLVALEGHVGTCAEESDTNREEEIIIEEPAAQEMEENVEMAVKKEDRMSDILFIFVNNN